MGPGERVLAAAPLAPQQSEQQFRGLPFAQPNGAPVAAPPVVTPLTGRASQRATEGSTSMCESAKSHRTSGPPEKDGSQGKVLSSAIDQ